MIVSAYQMRAFSLVELSIVLVILGLLTGGILAGQSLIRAAEIRSVATESARMMAAMQAFRDKYFTVPGDMPNATKFWGSLGGTGSDATCQVITNNGTTATCDGDGDGTFGLNFGSANTQYEVYRVWQHMANAGLIEGTYTGIVSGGMVPQVSVPPSKSGSKNFWIAFSGHSYGGVTTIYAGTTGAFGTDYGKNGLQLRSVNAGAGSGTLPLTPQEAWNVDTKLDDGTPGIGKIISNKGAGGAGNTLCTSAAGAAPSAADLSATYQLDVTSKDCWLFFRGVI